MLPLTRVLEIMRNGNYEKCFVHGLTVLGYFRRQEFWKLWEMGIHYWQRAHVTRCPCYSWYHYPRASQYCANRALWRYSSTVNLCLIKLLAPWHQRTRHWFNNTTGYYNQQMSLLTTLSRIWILTRQPTFLWNLLQSPRYRAPVMLTTRPSRSQHPLTRSIIKPILKKVLHPQTIWILLATVLDMPHLQGLS